MKNKMKKLASVILLAGMVLSGCNDKKAENASSENTTAETVKANDEKAAAEDFNKNDYTEYLICIADGKKYEAGNNSDITNAIVTIDLGNTLSINTSNGAQTSGASQEINFRLQSFDKTTPKNYDISAGSPMQIDKLNGTNEHFITTTSQPGAIKITEIKDGYIYGNFECTATGVEDPAKSIAVTNGEFKIRLKEK